MEVIDKLKNVSINDMQSQEDSQNKIIQEKIINNFFNNLQNEQINQELIEKLQSFYLYNSERIQCGQKSLIRQKQQYEEEKQEYSKIFNLNIRIESNCRELQKKMKEISVMRSQIEIEENKKHKEFIKACEDGIQNANQQFENCQKDNDEKEITNLAEEVKRLIQEYENRGNEILDMVRKIEQDEKKSNLEMIEKYTKIQQNYQESMQKKQEIENIKKELNDYKFRIVLFDQKQKDFLNSLSQANEMLEKVEQQVILNLSKVKTLQQQQVDLKNENNTSERTLLELINYVNFLLQNNELKQEIDKKKKLKDEISAECRKLQNQLKK